MGHIRFPGACYLCGRQASKDGMSRHLAACLARHEDPKGRAGTLYLLRVEGEDPLYWLDLEIAGRATLATLDRFLREVWLECCGHLSAFTIGGSRYLPPAALQDDLLAGNDLSMSASIGNALRSGVSRFSYDYDFGSTTRLRLRVAGQRQGRAAPRSPIRMLARNLAPPWRCSECSRPAMVTCSSCIYSGDPFFCAEHGLDHECGEEMLLPVVNSPRMGVCGYHGPASDGEYRPETEPPPRRTSASGGFAAEER